LNSAGDGVYGDGSGGGDVKLPLQSLYINDDCGADDHDDGDGTGGK
jgi:hypothetical protein